MKTSAKNFLDKLTDLIVRIEDYLVFEKKISLSEILIFLVLFGWMIWFILFDVKNATPTFSTLKYGYLWIIIFVLMLGCHVIGVIKKLLLIRLIICYLYATFWFTWLTIGLINKFTSPIVPTMFALFITSCFLCVRLKYEFKEQGK